MGAGLWVLGEVGFQKQLLCDTHSSPPPPPPFLCSVKEGANKEVLGILVSYRVKVKLVVSRGGYVSSLPSGSLPLASPTPAATDRHSTSPSPRRDVSVELPFVLMHPKPPEQSPAGLSPLGKAPQETGGLGPTERHPGGSTRALSTAPLIFLPSCPRDRHPCGYEPHRV